MERKILIYNMPEEKLNILEELSKEFEYEIVVALEDDLTRIVEDILNGSQTEGEDVEKEHVDINFMMMHNFDQEVFKSFLTAMKEKELRIPNKCVSTMMNRLWTLQDLLKENKEEHEIMEVYTHLNRARAFGQSLLDEGITDEVLINTLDEVDGFIAERKFDRQSLVDRYNKLAKILNEYI